MYALLTDLPLVFFLKQRNAFWFVGMKSFEN